MSNPWTVHCSNRIISRKQIREIWCPRPAVFRLPFRLAGSEYHTHLCRVCMRKLVRSTARKLHALSALEARQGRRASVLAAKRKRRVKP